jgi:hypothetical protein
MFLEKIGEKVNKNKRPSFGYNCYIGQVGSFNSLAFLNVTYYPINLIRKKNCNVNLLKIGFILGGKIWIFNYTAEKKIVRLCCACKKTLYPVCPSLFVVCLSAILTQNHQTFPNYSIYPLSFPNITEYHPSLPIITQPYHNHI